MRRRLTSSTLLALLVALLVAPIAGATPVVRHARVNGVSLGYRIVGRGRPLVLIPGYAFTMFDWDPRFVAALSARHRVVLFDNRGVATSTTRGNRVTIAQMASDTAGLIRALRLRRPDVLGWSMGGYIAQDLALEHPRMVGRLALASTDFGGSRAIRPQPWVLKDLENPRKILDVLFPRRAMSAGAAWEARIYRQAQQLGVVQYLQASGRIVGEQVKAAAGWESPGRGSYARLPGLRAATLIAAGVQDVVVPVGNARMLYARIARSKLTLFGGAGHAFLFQDPLAVARRINAFLA